MEKLELKHLAPYLPYRLNMLYDFDMGDVWTLDITNINAITEFDKPILKPLSDLTENEEWKRKLLSFLSNGRSDDYDSPITIHTKNKYSTFKIRMYTYKGLNSSELFEYTVYKDLDLTTTKYNLIEWALKNHFDVFGLIEKGLAIDKNKLAKTK